MLTPICSVILDCDYHNGPTAPLPPSLEDTPETETEEERYAREDESIF